MERDPARSPDLRAGDTDRARTVGLLRLHHADGRLSAEELAERSGQAGAARTLGDLDALVADLPALPPAATPAGTTATPLSMPPWPQGQGAAKRVFYRALCTYVVVNLFLVGVWAFGDRGNFWPAWTILGWGLAMAFYAYRVFADPSERGGR